MTFDRLAHYYHTVPELDQRLRAPSEERTHALSGAYRMVRQAVSALFGGFAESVHRSLRVRSTYGALSALSDHQLKDIGLHRTDIAAIAEALATMSPEHALTFQDLRRVGIVRFDGDDHTAASLPSVNTLRSGARSAPAERPRPSATADRSRAAA